MNGAYSTLLFFNEGGLTENPYLLSGYLRKHCNDTMEIFRNANE